MSYFKFASLILLFCKIIKKYPQFTFIYCILLLFVLNLGHSPFYRHFCKWLYIEMLKISHVY